MKKITIVGLNEGSDPGLNSHELLLIFLFGLKEGVVLNNEI